MRPGESSPRTKSSRLSFFGLIAALLATTTVPAIVHAKSSTWLHNGSTLELNAEGPTREFSYAEPRPSLTDVGVHPGTLLFKGRTDGRRYFGTAYLFHPQCGRVPYQVSGPIQNNYRRVVLKGEAPRFTSDCRIQGYFTDTLEFNLLEDVASVSPHRPFMTGERLTRQASGPIRSTPISSGLISQKKELFRTVMNEFYGAYDQDKQCWMSESQDRMYCMNPIRSDVIASGNESRIFVTVGGQEWTEDGGRCQSHPCLGVLGLIVLVDSGLANLGLRATSLYESAETYGRVPETNDIAVRQLGPADRYGWTIRMNEDHGRTRMDFVNVHAVIGDQVVLIGSLVTNYSNHLDCEERYAQCTDISSNLLIDQAAHSNEFYPMVLRASGVLRGQAFQATYRLFYDVRTFRYMTPPNMPNEIQPLNAF
jgi:hypothetical protein